MSVVAANVRCMSDAGGTTGDDSFDDNSFDDDSFDDDSFDDDSFDDRFFDPSAWLRFFECAADAEPVTRRVVLERILAATPDGSTALALAEIDASKLDAYDAVLCAQAWQRQQAWVDASLVAAELAVAGPDPQSDCDAGVLELGLALSVSKHAAAERARRARELADLLPATFEAWRNGRLTAGHVQVMRRELALAGRDAAAAVERAVLGGAGERPPGDLARRVRRALLEADPESAARRVRTARADRSVRAWPTVDGVGELLLTGPVEDVLRMRDSAFATARGRSGDDPRTLEQAAFDAIRDRLLGDGAALRPVEVGVVIDVTTLAGLTDHTGDVDGIGAVPASLARLLAGADGARWRRLLVDPGDGRLLERGRRSYRPTARQRDFVVTRDRVCRAGSCGTRARHGDVDHRTPHPDGPTDPSNLDCACRPHHVAKTKAGWTVRAGEADRLTWITASGHAYTSAPYDYRRSPLAPHSHVSDGPARTSSHVQRRHGPDRADGNLSPPPDGHPPAEKPPPF